MKRSKIVTVTLLITLMTVVFAGTALAQGPTDDQALRGFKLNLHIVLGTRKDSGKTELPAEISSAVRTAAREIGYRSFRLLSSRYQMVALGGRIHSRSIEKSLGEFDRPGLPVFSDWSLGPLLPVGPDPMTFELKRFHYEAKVPSKIGELDKYSNISLDLERVLIPVGRTVVIGTQSVPESGEMLFFVVRAAAID